MNKKQLRNFIVSLKSEFRIGVKSAIYVLTFEITSMDNINIKINQTIYNTYSSSYYYTKT